VWTRTRRKRDVELQREEKSNKQLGDVDGCWWRGVLSWIYNDNALFSFS